MFIRTERLFLRPGWPEDWQELLAGIGDEAVVRNLARAPWPYTADDARSFAAQPQADRTPHFVVTAPGPRGTQLIGACGLSRDDAGQVELGYWISRPHWGHGYATEAAAALLRIAPLLGHRRLVASHFADNPASGRVLRKLGLVQKRRRRVRHSGSGFTGVPVAQRPNHVWTVDFKGWWTLGSGERCEPLTVCDTYSRLVLATLIPTSTGFAAIKQVFGDHAYKLAVSGTKGYYGHALGASGAIEAAICALALSRGWLPPTLNLENPSVETVINLVPKTPVKKEINVALSNSFGFGGTNASLIFRKVA